MLKKAETEGIEPQSLGRLAPDEIFDYFAGEIFDKADKETQEFLLKTALLPKMTASLAEALTTLTSASRILSRLNRDNFFTERRFHSHPAYQYHPLFRQFLLSRAKEAFSRESLAILGRDAAMLLEDADETDAAIALLCDIGDWNAIAPLIIKHAPSMLAQGRNRPLEEWLGSLPKDMIENTLWLSFWKGACCIPFNPSLSRDYFEQAFERFKTEKDTAGIFLAWSGIVDSIAYGFEDFTLFDKWIRVLERLMNDFKAFPSEQIEARVASAMFKALAIRQPQHPEVEAWAERVLSLEGDSPTIITARMETLFQRLYHGVCIGNFEKAAVAIDSLGHLARSRDATPLARITMRLGEAIYYQFTGLHEKCLKAVSDGLELSRTTGVHLMDHMILGHAVASALNAGDCTTAGKWLVEMASTLSNLKAWEMSKYHFLKTREALLQEDLEQASLHAGLCLEFETKVGTPGSLSWIHLMKAQVMHQLEKHGEPTEHLAHAFSIARGMKSKLTEFFALMVKARFALDKGDEASGLRSLRKALAIGKEGGYLNTFVDQPSVTARLCARALEAGIEVEYVQDIIRKRNLVPDDPPMHLENWPWPLKIYTMGRFGLIRDGKPIRFSGKAQQKPLSVLKALIAFGGREVKKERIADALWPEAHGDMAHQSFATTLPAFVN
ncbi:MAG: hypothetical protein HWN68_01160 [Desulfobacterales bacterium]|nr:hypothetical protein [Desulfobacterales bacterium]